MNGFGTIFAVYMPVYIYAFCVLYLILLIGSYTPKNMSPSLYTFSASNRLYSERILFILTLMALLGTPPSIGFFAKIMTFYVLVKQSNIFLAVAIALTLVLIIFYLQTIRTRSILRKRGLSTFSRKNNKNALCFIYGQYILILTVLIMPYIFDALYTLYI